MTSKFYIWKIDNKTKVPKLWLETTKPLEFQYIRRAFDNSKYSYSTRIERFPKNRNVK